MMMMVATNSRIASAAAQAPNPVSQATNLLTERARVVVAPWDSLPLREASPTAWAAKTTQAMIMAMRMRTTRKTTTTAWVICQATLR